MSSSPPILRRGIEKSNTELTTSLRANFKAAASSSDTSEPSSTSWTMREGSEDLLYIPALDFSQTGLSEERSQYDVTVKLFYLPSVPPERRCAHTKQAIELVLKELHIENLDLLIISFPGIAFDADDEDSSDPDSPADEVDDIREGGSGSESGQGVEDIDTMIRTWQTLETLVDEGIIKRLGISEFGSARLEKLLERARIKPGVDQINVRDCCVVPRPLIMFAKEKGIELLTHNDCTNILPRGTLRELLGPAPNGVGVLAGQDETEDGLKGDVEPQWVVKYTAVVKDRGVVENKGYFAVAEMKE